MQTMPEQHILDRLTTLEAKIDKLNSTVSSMQGQWIIRSGAAGDGIEVSGGSTVNAMGATGTTSETPNTLTAAGIIFQ